MKLDKKNINQNQVTTQSVCSGCMGPCSGDCWSGGCKNGCTGCGSYCIGFCDSKSM
jgi:hypothetical protein